MSKERVVILEPLSADGESKAVLVDEAGEVREAGMVATLKEGQPIHGDELMAISPTANPSVYDVQSRMSLKGNGSKGPPKVATQEYRNNYDQIFGSPESLPN